MTTVMVDDEEIVYEDDVVSVRFNLFGYIDAEAASEFVQSMWEQNTIDPTAEWEIVLNSEGGDMEAGTAIYSELVAYSHRGGGSHYVTTRVRGQAASCASLILQAGDFRTAGSMDFIMLHEPLISLCDATLTRVRDELEQAEAWTENYIDILVERGNRGRKYYADNLSGHDWWLPAGEALAIGMIDDVA